MTVENRRRPEAFSIEDAPSAPAAERTAARSRAPRRPTIIETPPPPEPAPPALRMAPPRRRRLPFVKLLIAGLGGLVSMALTAWGWSLVENMFARSNWLGWMALSLAGLAGIGVIGLLAREIFAFFRLGHIARLRDDAAAAAAGGDRRAAIGVARAMIAHFADRPDMARARTLAGAHLDEIIDARDLVMLVERDLLSGPDEAARALVRASAKRVSVLTAISPRAIVDLVFVLFEVTRLSRRIAEVYGGRPSGLAFLGLLRRIGLHLTVTGGIAMSDAIVQQLVGHGLAARLSARLGEGLFNGMMTARVGLAAIEVCRPMPFAGLKPPGISDLARDLIAGADKAAAEAEKSKN
ncbi:MAG: TIGR01620 family protein [Rhodobiaceae bacterium]|nr:TIGR01620 family protein [Rhodobiaceae bacterium]MCC0055759.1 TIGR01620 family protein [Rhodobiaceae bacterium]